MNRCCAVSACLSLMLSLCTGWSQEFRNDTGHAGDKELRRTAHRLHMPEERLKNARAVLREATELAGSLDPVPLGSLSQIAEAWVQLDRDRAPGAIESLYLQLSASAAKASDAQIYQSATSAAQGLLNPLADVDHEKALQLIRQWPPRPGSSEDASISTDQLEAQLRSQIVQRMTYTDPGAASQLLSGIDASLPPDYSMRGQVALQLARDGDIRQAEQIADQVIADFKQRTPGADSVAAYADFLTSLSMMDSSLFRNAFALLPPLLTDQTLGAASTAMVQVGDKSIALSPAELSIMNVFRGLQGKPQLAMSTLDALPDLSAKIESIGGLDNFLNPSMTSGPATDAETIPQGEASANAPARSLRPKDTVESLCTELRGKYRKTPGRVRSRLSEVASDPARLEILVGLAQRVAIQDPDLSSAALKEAASHLRQVDPIHRRVLVLEMLLSAYRQCLGEVDPQVIVSGFEIADALRQKEEQESSGSEPSSPTQSDQLEAILLSELARDDFSAAMRFLKTKPGDDFKVVSLMRIVDALRSGY